MYVNGKRVKVLRGRRLRSRSTCAGCRTGRYTVRVVVTTTRGKRIVTTRRYRTCVPKRARKARSASQPAVLFAAGRDTEDLLYFCRLPGGKRS